MSRDQEASGVIEDKALLPLLKKYVPYPSVLMLFTQRYRHMFVTC